MEADRVGIRTLAAAGFDPRAMAEFFQRLEEQSRLYGNQIPDILLSHPVDSVRIAEAQERAAQYPKRKVASSTQYYLIRARARVLGFDLPSQAIDYYASEIKSGHDTAEDQYGYAMALSTAAKDAEALKALAPLYKQMPDQPNVALLEARLLLADSQTQAALPIFRKVLHRYPSYAPAILETASALIRAGHPRQARAILLSHDQSFGTQVKTYQLLARAARRLGDVAEAQYQQARYHEAQGDLRGALEQVKAGLRLASLSADGRARLKAEQTDLMRRIPKAELRAVNRQQDGG
jgi:Putative Zn-dependent protease, contains TPR repeats